MATNDPLVDDLIDFLGESSIDDIYSDNLVLSKNAQKNKRIDIDFSVTDKTKPAEVFNSAEIDLQDKGVKPKTISSAKGVGDVSNLPVARTQSEKKQLDLLERKDLAAQRFNLARAGVDILNANLEFEQISSKAKQNLALAEFQKNEILSIGAQEALRAESAGFAKGELAKIRAAAQGQDVSGGIAESAQLAEETFGIFNAMMIEANAVRQAFGYEARKAAIQSDVNIAEINRNAAIATAGLSAIAGSPDAFENPGTFFGFNGV